ncbi:twin transmembrane helix small protein [Nioella aestuarii]|uniref:twin transmembrane helix small protein n=1 Tax=Nioella aestuarii TaxID=1662864 RepID=UPI003D7F81E4
MVDTLTIIALIVTVGVAIILMFGIGTYTRGGEFNRRNANKIMRWRLAVQFVAVILIALVVYLRGNGG